MIRTTWSLYVSVMIHTYVSIFIFVINGDYYDYHNYYNSLGTFNDYIPYLYIVLSKNRRTNISYTAYSL
jgi:hypothetical protein